jgi:hypothetical protein
MKWLKGNFVGRITIAAGIVSIFQVITLFGFFGGSGLSAMISDVLVSVNALLVIPLFLALGLIVGKQEAKIGRLIQILGVSGTLAKLTGSLLLISGLLPYEQSVVGENIGNVLMGTAIVLFFMRKAPEIVLKRRYIWFSVVLGIVMIASLVGIIFGDEQFTQILDGSVPMSEANPLIVGMLIIMAPISLFGWPTWLIGTARLFLKGKLSLED